MNMIRSKCNLCHKAAGLANSHIIPELLYKPMYDPKHRLHALRSGVPHKYLQKGLRERLFCAGCEAIFNELESRMDKFFFHAANCTIVENRDSWFFEGLDYKTMKLFYLSILWRMGVSSLREFSQVKLGLKHQEQIRQMILARDPRSELTYPIAAAIPTLADKIRFDLIICPQASRAKNGLRTYVMVLHGWHFVFSVGSHRPSPQAIKFIIKENGSWLVPLGPGEKVRLIVEAFASLNFERKRTRP